jgi:UPF0176 protein
VSITAFYTFCPLDAVQLSSLHDQLTAFGQKNNMRGLVLLAEEGINGTVCGSSDAIAAWKKHVTAQFGDITFKDSLADRHVFRRWSVKVKPEIVGLKRPDVVPQGKNNHLSPAEFDRMLKEEDVVVLDARNSYEYGIGKFTNAIDCGTTTFSQFPEFVANADIPKDKKVLMYCTGGIRCEKASLAMQEKGYRDVYQLDGGILAYLEQFPEAAFEGECLVFDQRCAVDQHLRPSQTYNTCPHCGMPGSESVLCRACKSEQKICSDCARIDHRHACSKHCAYVIKNFAQSAIIA